MYHLCTIQTVQTICIPSMYHLCTIQTVHTIHVWYKIFYIFLLLFVYGTKFFIYFFTRSLCKSFCNNYFDNSIFSTRRWILFGASPREIPIFRQLWFYEPYFCIDTFSIFLLFQNIETTVCLLCISIEGSRSQTEPPRFRVPGTHHPLLDGARYFYSSIYVSFYASHFVCFYLSIHIFFFVDGESILCALLCTSFAVFSLYVQASYIYFIRRCDMVCLASTFSKTFFLLCCFAELARVPLEKIYIRRSRTYMENSFADVASNVFPTCFPKNILHLFFLFPVEVLPQLLATHLFSCLSLPIHRYIEIFLYLVLFFLQ